MLACIVRATAQDLSTGFVLCHPRAPVRTARVFDAHLAIIEHKNIICAGFKAVMHIHTCVEEVTISVRSCRAGAAPGRTADADRWASAIFRMRRARARPCPGVASRHRQEDGKEDQDAAQLCQAGPGGDRAPGDGWPDLHRAVR